MSVSHTMFGPGAVKSRSTRSSCTGGPGFLDRPRLRACAETIPACEHTFHTRRSDTSCPASASSSAMSRYPNPGSSRCTSNAALVAYASTRSRSETGADFQE